MKSIQTPTIVFILLVFVAILTLSSLTTRAQSSCTNYYLSGIPTPTGYGASYDVIGGTNALLASIDCSGSTPVFTVGHNSDADYVYSKGYVYTSSWQEISFSSPNPAVATVWYPKIATASVPPPSSSWTFVVGYVCSWTGTAWKCGCADSACATSGWNLQAYEAESQFPPPGGTTGGTWGGTPNANAVVIAPSGSDANPCTVSAPCASLEKAQSAVRSSSTKIVYLRSGAYSRSQTLILTSADNGETWQTYPGDPVDSAVLDGGGSVDGILCNGCSNVTVNGITIQNVSTMAVGIHGGAAADVPQWKAVVPTASGNTVTNCIIHDVKGITPNGWSSALWAYVDVPSTSFTHNLVYNVPSEALSIQSYNSGSIANGLIDGNAVYHVSTVGGGDTGAIYTQQVDVQSVNSTNIHITNNFIRDWDGGKGIYLDDGASNTTVTGNVIAPPQSAGAGTVAIFLHGGNNNTFAENIIDLGATGRTIIFAAGGSSVNTAMTNNIFSRNTIISGFTGSQQTSWWGANGYSYYYTQGAAHVSISMPQVSGNIYHNYTGGPEVTTGTAFNDSSPIHQTPNLSGWTYKTGTWGPPGYTIPQTGTSPSSPH